MAEQGAYSVTSELDNINNQIEQLYQDNQRTMSSKLQNELRGFYQMKEVVIQNHYQHVFDTKEKSLDLMLKEVEKLVLKFHSFSANETANLLSIFSEHHRLINVKLIEAIAEEEKSRLVIENMRQEIKMLKHQLLEKSAELQRKDKRLIELEIAAENANLPPQLSNTDQALETQAERKLKHISDIEMDSFSDREETPATVDSDSSVDSSYHSSESRIRHSRKTHKRNDTPWNFGTW
ncbi:uncharacterized protein LOC124336425 isoform X2 [Daphnia pulicaria]|nr:uncharacterized protein LOC124336425 isoform X2 [Daphnia pulicaria]XP_046646189.1 uncharacterized protein LOC124336425 isoform X2 [Daphnia pulicaria]